MPITSRRARTRGRTVVRQPPEPGNEAPEATGGGSKVLDAISGPAVLSAPSGKTYGTVATVDGSTRLSTKFRRWPRSVSTKTSGAVDKVWTAVAARHGSRGLAAVSRPSRTSRSSATWTSPPTEARSSGRRGATRSARGRRRPPRPGRPSAGPPGRHGRPPRRGTCRAARRRTGGPGCTRCRTAPSPRR